MSLVVAAAFVAGVLTSDAVIAILNTAKDTAVALARAAAKAVKAAIAAAHLAE